MPNLQIIIGSTRPGRSGPKVGAWFVEQARSHSGFDVMMPIPEAVALPFFARSIDKESGTFLPDAIQEKAARAMLDELLRWAGALRQLRA